MELKDYKTPDLVKKRDDQSIVDKIVEVTGTTARFGYPYWLRKVKHSKLSPNRILDLVDEARGLDVKYNRGGFISKRI